MNAKWNIKQCHIEWNCFGEMKDWRSVIPPWCLTIKMKRKLLMSFCFQLWRPCYASREHGRTLSNRQVESPANIRAHRKITRRAPRQLRKNYKCGNRSRQKQKYSIGWTKRGLCSFCRTPKQLKKWKRQNSSSVVKTAMKIGLFAVWRFGRDIILTVILVRLKIIMDDQKWILCTNMTNGWDGQMRRTNHERTTRETNDQIKM